MAPAKAAAGDRIYSRVRHLWVRPLPNSKAWIGYLSLGDSVRVKDGNAEVAFKQDGYGGACDKWYAVEPLGFVCVGKAATFDKDDPVVVALRGHQAKRDQPWPYQYAESLETPVYHQVPEPRKQLTTEPLLQKHLDRLAEHRAAIERGDVEALRPDSEDAAGRKSVTPITVRRDPFVGVDLTVAGKAPPTFIDLPVGGRPVKTRVAFGSTLAYVDSFDHAGRTFLLTWDRGVVPKDKVRPYAKSTFAGVALNDQVQLPIAFVRRRDRPQYRRAADGSFDKLPSTWKRLGWMGLSGRSEVVDKIRYLETNHDGLWCAAADVSVARRASQLPARIRKIKEGRRSWLDISIVGGTLVAYEHLTPVYATLISPGRGGLPHPGIDALETASTPVGSYFVLAKFITATMVSSSDASLVHSEVQYTQNIIGPYALHGAYWHERWGEPKSGGCVNLAPIDAQRIFSWTSPQLPAGWHGMRTIEFPDKTLVHLHR